MLDKTIIIAILFRLINFIALLGLAYYLFKRYMLPSIRKRIHEKKYLLEELGQQKNNLEYQHNQLYNELLYQEQEKTALLSKVKKWRVAVHQMELIKQEDAIQISRLATIRLDRQLKESMRHGEEINIINPALHKAENELHQLYSNENEGKNFLKNIIHHMQKNS